MLLLLPMMKMTMMVMTMTILTAAAYNTSKLYPSKHNFGQHRPIDTHCISRPYFLPPADFKHLSQSDRDSQNTLNTFFPVLTKYCPILVWKQFVQILEYLPGWNQFSPIWHSFPTQAVKSSSDPKSGANTFPESVWSHNRQLLFLQTHFSELSPNSNTLLRPDFYLWQH